MGSDGQSEANNQTPQQRIHREPYAFGNSDTVAEFEEFSELATERLPDGGARFEARNPS
jgi:hypothetical protein